MFKIFKKQVDLRFWAVLAVAAAVIFLLCWKKLFIFNLIPLDGNMVDMSYPNWLAAREAWSEFRLPLWNPLRNMGEPHLADPQTTALYPPFILFSPIKDFVDFLRAWVTVHTAIAVFFMGLLAHRLYKDIPAGIAGALVAGFNGFFISRVTMPHQFASMAWVSAILYFQAAGSVLGMGICLAFQWLAGYPPISLITVIMAGAVAVSRGREGVKKLAAAGAIALGLSAVQLIPFIEFLGNSIRPVVLQYDTVISFSLTLKQLFKEVFVPQWYALMPEIPGDPAIICFYTGLIVIGLAVLGVVRGSVMERRIGVVILVAFLLSLGGSLPFYRYLKFLHLFRFPANWLLPAVIGIALLCAGGLRGIKSVRWKWIFLVLIAADLTVFAQFPRSAWAKLTYFTDEPGVMGEIGPAGYASRIYHTDRFSANLEKSIKGESDYLFFREYLTPSFATSFGYHEVSSYQMLTLKKAAAYQQRLSRAGLDSQLLDLAGIQTVFMIEEGNKDGLISEQKVRIAVRETYRKRVFLDDESAGVADIVEYSPGRVRARVKAFRECSLIFSEVVFPGWKAVVGDKEEAILPFEDTFMSIPITAGKHDVVFSYKPLSFRIGLIITLLTIFMLALWNMRKRRL